MADRMSAEIWIGGKLRRRLLEEIPLTNMRLDWDEHPLESTSAEGLLAARDENRLLHFCDCEAAYGEFQELEGWLRECKIPFRRHSSGKYEYLPETVEFRPDLGKGNVEVYCLTTDAGEPLIARSALAPTLAAMAKLRRSNRSLASQLQAWKRLASRLARLVPSDLPPLPPFEIV